jgi:hypothetical protein
MAEILEQDNTPFGQEQEETVSRDPASGAVTSDNMLIWIRRRSPYWRRARVIRSPDATFFLYQPNSETRSTHSHLWRAGPLPQIASTNPLTYAAPSSNQA